MKLLEVPGHRPARGHGRRAKRLSDYDLWGAVPMVLLHLAPLGALWTGTRWQDWAVCFGLLWLRMFGVTAGYHRYFSHRTFKTSRVMQFLFALLAQSSSQKGVLWWAAHHRDHHKYSDTERDAHSPISQGLAYAHIGWLFDDTAETDYTRVKDLARYPELVLLNRFWPVVPVLLGVGVWLVLGWSGLWIGFALSTVLCWHSTFLINSLTHVFGSQRFETNEGSRNHWLLALLTLGEGWHNNHHYYQSSTRQGFYWWELDISYAILKAMSWVGLVWDLRAPPPHVYEEAKRQRERRRLTGASADGRSAPSLPAPAAPGSSEPTVILPAE